MKKKQSLEENRLRHIKRLAEAAKNAGIEVEMCTSVVRPVIEPN